MNRSCTCPKANRRACGGQDAPLRAGGSGHRWNNRLFVLLIRCARVRPAALTLSHPCRYRAGLTHAEPMSEAAPIHETIHFLRERFTRAPHAILVLGSGLSGLADEIEGAVA